VKLNICWNQSENRIRAGWRILIQILLVAVPLALFGFSGFYNQGNLAVKMTLTALPITLLSVVVLARYVDKRKISDLGLQITQIQWWKDYVFGLVAGVLAASSVTLLLFVFGWADVVPSGQFNLKAWSFLGSFLISLLAYTGVGVFEEIMRSYQILNISEGLSGSRISLPWAPVIAVLAGAAWSVLAHLGNPDPSLLIYILVTGVIYGCFFVWTRRAALAIAMHAAWDFTNSSIFQLGATSETSLYYVRLGDLPVLPIDVMSLLGIIAKVLGLLLVLWWIRPRKRKSQIKTGLGSPDQLTDRGNAAK